MIIAETRATRREVDCNCDCDECLACINGMNRHSVRGHVLRGSLRTDGFCIHCGDWRSHLTRYDSSLIGILDWSGIIRRETTARVTLQGGHSEECCPHAAKSAIRGRGGATCRVFNAPHNNLFRIPSRYVLCHGSIGGRVAVCFPSLTSKTPPGRRAAMQGVRLLSSGFAGTTMPGVWSAIRRAAKRMSRVQE